MKISKNFTILITGIFTLAILLPCLDTYAQKQESDFEGMKGTRFEYPVNDKDSLSAMKIIELRNEKGLPEWFSREFSKPVCLTGECKMVHLRIYWNGAANYLGMYLFEPLTKTDHAEFTPENYLKLNRILSDPESVLKGFKIEDLTVEVEDKNKDKVDAKSGATQPLIVEYVVRNAVYTCYTLWNTVYGPTLEKIRLIIEERTNIDYLRQIFNQKDPQYISWAIDFIDKHSEYQNSFYHDIMNQIKTDDPVLSEKASRYFTAPRLSDNEIQKELAMMMSEVSSHGKYEIISIFSELQLVNNDAILILLAHFENKKINAGMLGYVCKMINPENLEDRCIIEKLNILSKDNNPFVRKMAQNVLSGEKNNN